MRTPVEQRRQLGVAIGVPTMAEALVALAGAADEADIAELRLDYFAEPYDLARLLGARRLPVIVTNRPLREGGRCAASEEERLAVLRRAADLGAEYVDLEWDAATPSTVVALKEAGATVVVSRHCFCRTPEDVESWPSRAVERGADVVKVVGMARDVRDTLPFFRILDDARRPTIAIAMGTAGLPSRVLALRYESCLLSFAAPSTGPGTAPGQISLRDMREVYRVERLGRSTAVYGLLGSEVETAQAAAFNRHFAQTGVDAVAVPFPAAHDAVGILTAFRALPVAGWHVRSPHLQAEATRVVDDLTPSARRRGKVNSLTERAGRLVGAWVESPEEQLRAWFAA